MAEEESVVARFHKTREHVTKNAAHHYKHKREQYVERHIMPHVPKNVHDILQRAADGLNNSRKKKKNKSRSFRSSSDDVGASDLVMIVLFLLSLGPMYALVFMTPIVRVSVELYFTFVSPATMTLMHMEKRHVAGHYYLPVWVLVGFLFLLERNLKLIFGLGQSYSTYYMLAKCALIHAISHHEFCMNLFQHQVYTYILVPFLWQGNPKMTFEEYLSRPYTEATESDSSSFSFVDVPNVQELVISDLSLKSSKKDLSIYLIFETTTNLHDYSAPTLLEELFESDNPRAVRSKTAVMIDNDDTPKLVSEDDTKHIYKWKDQPPISVQVHKQVDNKEENAGDDDSSSSSSSSSSSYIAGMKKDTRKDLLWPFLHISAFNDRTLRTDSFLGTAYLDVADLIRSKYEDDDSIYHEQEISLKRKKGDSLKRLGRLTFSIKCV